MGKKVVFDRKLLTQMHVAKLDKTLSCFSHLSHGERQQSINALFSIIVLVIMPTLFVHNHYMEIWLELKAKPPFTYF